MQKILQVQRQQSQTTQISIENDLPKYNHVDQITMKVDEPVGL